MNLSAVGIVIDEFIRARGVTIRDVGRSMNKSASTLYNTMCCKYPTNRTLERIAQTLNLTDAERKRLHAAAARMPKRPPPNPPMYMSDALPMRSRTVAGAMLGFFRIRAKMTRAEVASALGVKRSYLITFERGWAVPPPAHLATLVDIFGLTADERYLLDVALHGRTDDDRLPAPRVVLDEEAVGVVDGGGEFIPCGPTASCQPAALVIQRGANAVCADPTACDLASLAPRPAPPPPAKSKPRRKLPVAGCDHDEHDGWLGVGPGERFETCARYDACVSSFVRAHRGANLDGHCSPTCSRRMSMQRVG